MLKYSIMKGTRQHRWLKFIPLILLLACSGGRRYDNQNSMPEKSAVPSQSTQSATQQSSAQSGTEYYFNTADNVSVGMIDLKSPVYFQLDNTSLRRVVKGDKSKYRNENNQNVYEIKYDDDGFKLRTDQGKLLWKLKYKTGKIKIAPNEEMTDPFEIKPDGNTAVISKNNSTVVSVNLGEGTIPVIIKTGSRTLMISGPKKNPVLSLMALKDIPDDQKMVLITEVLLSDH